MRLIGITGGIGSGKSTVAKQFEEQGFPVYYTDRAAKRLAEEDAEVRSQIAALLGEEVYQDGHYQTRIVASRVFADERLLQGLNAILHPAVREDILRWKAGLGADETAYIECALLFESGLNALCDKVICVTAPEDVCVARVMKRDGTSEEAVRARIAAQMPDEERQRLSDEVYYNN